MDGWRHQSYETGPQDSEGALSPRLTRTTRGILRLLAHCSTDNNRKETNVLPGLPVPDAIFERKLRISVGELVASGGGAFGVTIWTLSFAIRSSANLVKLRRPVPHNQCVLRISLNTDNGHVDCDTEGQRKDPWAEGERSDDAPQATE